jgi:hypothetical protein
MFLVTPVLPFWSKAGSSASMCLHSTIPLAYKALFSVPLSTTKAPRLPTLEMASENDHVWKRRESLQTQKSTPNDHVWGERIWNLINFRNV